MWTIANPDHISLLESEFAELRETRGQQYVSYLAEPGIIDFHRERLTKRIHDNPENSRLYLCMDDSRALALLGVDPSTYHQNFFQTPYYKILPFFCFSTEEPDIARLAEEMKDLFTLPKSLYTTRIEANHYYLAYHLARIGFLPVGTSVRLVRENLHNECVDSSAPQSYDNYKIRPFEEADLSALQDIIRRSHRHSHFFCEARFDPERVQVLFAEWIAQCASNPNFRILAAESQDGVIGFCSAMIQRSLKPYIQRSIGIIDFIVVDYRIQGKGTGKALLDAALDWFKPETDTVELRTMADNLQAIRFYEKNGFRMLSADQHFHLWTA